MKRTAKIGFLSLLFIILVFQTLDSELHPFCDQTKISSTAGVEAQKKLKWIYTGGPIGGLGYDVRMHPDAPDIMFVTDALGGVFKSVDGGKTWAPRNRGITSRVGLSGDGIPVFCLTIDPNIPNIVWAGTQFSSGIFRSIDGGNNWKLMNKGIKEQKVSFRGITVEPGNSDVVYAAGEISSWEWNSGPTLQGKGQDLTKGVVYKTTDRGRNWRRIWYGDNLCRYIWIHPEDHNLVYVSTGIFDREAANSNPDDNDPGGVGILRSPDGGKSWEVLNAANGFAPGELFIGSLYMHPHNPDILIAASGLDPYSPNGGVYLTEDGGDTWVEVLDVGNMSSVEFSESDPNIVYAGSVEGFYRSWDGGHTWEKLAGAFWGPEDVVAGFPIDFQVDPRNPLRIFVNNYGGGNFLSENGGETWVVSSSGYTGALMSQIVVAVDNPDLVYTTARSGVFKSLDGGKSWQGLSRGVARAMEGIAIAVDPRDSQHIMATVLDSSPDPLESRDGGKTWTNVITKIWKKIEEQEGKTVTRIMFHPSKSKYIYATIGDFEFMRTAADPVSDGNGVIISRNRGKTWKKTNLKKGNVLGIAACPSQSKRLYAAVYRKGFYRSDNFGKRWKLVNRDPLASLDIPTPEDENSQLPGIISLAVDPEDPKLIFAGLYKGSIAISNDGGNTWALSSAGMPPELTVRAIEIDQNNGAVIYVASIDKGVYRSTDKGLTWKAINNGLITRAGKDLALASDSSVLYLATEGGGVFRLDLGNSK